jgi:carbonic anhydrase
LPITGVIVRSSANISAGGRSRASTILHGVWMLLFAVVFLDQAEYIPTAALAGLLVFVGIQLIKLAEVQKARKTGDLLVYVVTILGVIFLNLLQGVILGLLVALALVFWRVVRVHIAVDPPGRPAALSGSERWRVVIEGSATFLALPKLTEAFAKIPPQAPVTLVMAVDFIDHGAQSAIEDWCFQHEAAGGDVVVQEVGLVDLAGASDAPPKRGTLGDVLRRSLTPWDSWAPGGSAEDEAGEVSGPNATAHPAVRSVLAGVAHYHRRHAPLLVPHLERLRDEQSPEILFITCGDSRIVPNVITSSGPGDLFTIRNVGNLVKPEGEDPSMDAALAFAIDKLEVRSVVLCGHSSCGAMAQLALDLPPSHPLSVWLDQVDASRQSYAQGHPVAAAAGAQGYGPNDQLGMVNVLMQVESLRRHPVIARAIAARGLTVTGLFFDISTGNVVHVEDDKVTVVDDSHPLLLHHEPDSAAAMRAATVAG